MVEIACALTIRLHPRITHLNLRHPSLLVVLRGEPRAHHPMLLHRVHLMPLLLRAAGQGAARRSRLLHLHLHLHLHLRVMLRKLKPQAICQRYL